MKAVLLLVVAVECLAVTAHAEPAAGAKEAEEAAFDAIDAEHWCEAMGHFLKANALEPNPDHVFNAAKAAETGGDRARAVQLYTELLGVSTAAPQRAQAKKKITSLTAEVEKSGAGTKCPPLVDKPAPVEKPAPPPPPPVVAAPPPPGSVIRAPPTLPPAQTPSRSAIAPLERERRREPHVVETAAPTPQKLQDDAEVPWGVVTFASGGFLTVAGAVGLIIGASQWASYDAARENLARLSDDRSSPEFAAASAARGEAAQRWESVGEPATVAGGILAGAGVLVAVIGAAVMIAE